ncbi:MAG: adenylosuccinate lyase [Bacteroidales bacterium]|nr:adenylosuccinate lyase [Bacteroidales bacterium]
MKNSDLLCISPVDGRYSFSTKELSPYFSEKALIKYRIQVEIEYFIALLNLPLEELKSVKISSIDKLKNIYLDFKVEDAEKVKAIEKTTNHDIKAIEYFIKEKYDEIGLTKYKEFVHFALTSQDINNTAFPMMIKDAQENVMIGLLEELTALLKKSALGWKDIPMLAYTHGQPASPTCMGKEILVFVSRLEHQINQLRLVPFSAKFGGATGNFNAHNIAYPEVDWIGFADNFVNNILGLQRSKVTTQIENYDNMAAFCDAYKRINTILLDLCKDIWMYISMDYFKICIKKGEVGSSAMPHKVNPIDFENAEGNLGLANALFEHLASKLPVSRLQRDLTDSTVLRNIGVPLAHTLIAIKSILRGLEKLSINQAAINKDLDDNWAVVAEAIQTILRKEFYPEPYEKLKELTRTGQKITNADIEKFINNLEISDELKKYLKKITPFNYTGITNSFFE